MPGADVSFRLRTRCLRQAPGLALDLTRERVDPGGVGHVGGRLEVLEDPVPSTNGYNGNSNHSQQIVQKLWNYCNVLRDDGMSYARYADAIDVLPFQAWPHVHVIQLGDRRHHDRLVVEPCSSTAPSQRSVMYIEPATPRPSRLSPAPA